MIHCTAAIIGGSSTCSINFPAELKDPDTKLLEENLTYATPFGNSPPFTLFELNGENVLTCRMHGWRSGVSRGAASQQVFWVLKEAGVKRIIVEGGVGSLCEDLVPGDKIIPHDYIDFSHRRDVSLGDDFLLIMREPLCPELRALLITEAKKVPGQQVKAHGVYAVTEGRHFESRAEIELFSKWHVDVVGQSLAPEVYLAREIGACYAGVYLVVNFAEGICGDWSHETLSNLFYREAHQMGQLLLDSLKTIIKAPHTCACATFRKPSLLKKYIPVP
ncbi:MAG: MTAP family purine nucleoside phosphorylase [Proteobacteria bacterium]|nr:MTAP family purine nucleoside phosphorylase [Pseudomonadota bacterium]